MATIVNLRRIDRLEEKMGGTNWVQCLSDQQLDAIVLAIGSGEHKDARVLSQEERDESAKYLEPIAARCSNYPDFLDKVLDELQALGAPKAAILLVEAVKEVRLSAPYLWPDWSKGLSQKVLEMLNGDGLMEISR